MEAETTLARPEYWRRLDGPGTPATFFLTGRFVRLYPTVARQVGRRFPVGDHTVDHADLTRLPAAQVAWEIEAARTQIRRVTGSDAKPWFRFPYGARDARTVGIARRLGYLPVRWTVDAWGWMGSCCQTAKGVLQRTLADLMPGEIVLMHLGSARDGSRLDAQALAAVIAAVRARGFRFTTFAGYAVRPRWQATTSLTRGWDSRDDLAPRSVSRAHAQINETSTPRALLRPQPPRPRRRHQPPTPDAPQQSPEPSQKQRFGHNGQSARV